jgi:hypothetical protein
MFLFFLFLFYLSSFLKKCIYLFCFYFLFQKDSSFFNMFYNERGRRDVSERGEQEENVCTTRRSPKRPNGCYGLPAGLVGGCLP